jgi:hypothetical protein
MLHLCNHVALMQPRCTASAAGLVGSSEKEVDKNLKESKKRSKKEEEDRRREEKQRLKEEKAALKAAKENKGEKDKDRDRDRDKDREKVLNMRPRACMRAHASMHFAGANLVSLQKRRGSIPSAPQPGGAADDEPKHVPTFSLDEL